jgi:hypothetical protein
MNRTDITHEVDSRRPFRFHPAGHIMVNKKELLESILEQSFASNGNSRFFNPIAYHLEQINWSVFGTITFKNDSFTYDNKVSEQERSKVFHRLIGCTCTKLRLRNRRLIYYKRTEWGAGQRGHINFLIGKNGTESVTPLELSEKMQTFWTGGLFPIGTAVIEPFRKELHSEGIRYQSKYEFDSQHNLLNDYEEFSDLLLKRIHTNIKSINDELSC